ncbi:hypothetical protein [Mesobacillus zeae]|uniref:Uncharacterized protein n=1 Tax=Mesobacillus zeae TaxID=1917180 RepID=A0A398BF08_9BACI|nr:hypothetical protein [Mesobacillus zeae]RID88835.1 hypothetical protein D1970_00895 [Mesobacillus zeae]
MVNPVLVFLACILAGFALVNLPAVPMLSGLVPFFEIVAALAIIIFSFVLLYMGLRALFSGTWL